MDPDLADGLRVVVVVALGILAVALLMQWLSGG